MTIESYDYISQIFWNISEIGTIFDTLEVLYSIHWILGWKILETFKGCFFVACKEEYCVGVQTGNEVQQMKKAPVYNLARND